MSASEEGAGLETGRNKWLPFGTIASELKVNGRTLDRKGGDLFGVNPIARSAFRKILLSKASIHLSIGRLFSLSRNFDLGNQFGLALGGLLIGFDGEVSGGTRVGAFLGLRRAAEPQHAHAGPSFLRLSASCVWN